MERINYYHSLLSYGKHLDAEILRDLYILQDHLLKGKTLKKVKIGNTTLMPVTAEDAIRCTYEMLDKNIYFYTGVNSHE